jgi:hypothetical protein
MARTGGTMTIPNTFSSGAIITASGHNQNNTDIANEITNSLALDGQSTMTGQVKGKNGDASSPAYTFGSDTDSGIYRLGANNIGIGVNGAKVLDIATTGLSIVGTLSPSGQIVSSAGTAGAPGISFTGDLDNGLYLIGTNNVGMSIGGAKVVDYATTGIRITGTLGSSGNFAINTDKFTVAASSGNMVVAGTAAIAGDVAINTDKFTVAASSGNAAIAGTASVTGVFTANNASGIVAKNVAKAYAYFTVSGTTVSFTASTQGFNVASVTRTGTGAFDIVFTNNLSGTNYTVNVSGSSGRIGTVTNRATTGFTVTFTSSSQGTALDPSDVSLSVFGL